MTEPTTKAASDLKLLALNIGYLQTSFLSEMTKIDSLGAFLRREEVDIAILSETKTALDSEQNTKREEILRKYKYNIFFNSFTAEERCEMDKKANQKTIMNDSRHSDHEKQERINYIKASDKPCPAGVALVVNEKLKDKIKIMKTSNRNIIHAVLDYKENEKIHIFGMYGNTYKFSPNSELVTQQFANIENMMAHAGPGDHIILTGDLNATLNIRLDRSNPNAAPTTADNALRKLVVGNNLQDVWRIQNPQAIVYTYQKIDKASTPASAATVASTSLASPAIAVTETPRSRIDNILISNSLLSACKQARIHTEEFENSTCPSYDHCPISLILLGEVLAEERNL